jgi:hypothetical protein
VSRPKVTSGNFPRPPVVILGSVQNNFEMRCYLYHLRRSTVTRNSHRHQKGASEPKYNVVSRSASGGIGILIAEMAGNTEDANEQQAR